MINAASHAKGIKVTTKITFMYFCVYHIFLQFYEISLVILNKINKRYFHDIKYIFGNKYVDW